MVINIHLEIVINLAVHITAALLAFGLFTLGEITLEMARRRRRNEGREEVRRADPERGGGPNRRIPG